MVNAWQFYRHYKVFAIRSCLFSSRNEIFDGRLDYCLSHSVHCLDSIVFSACTKITQARPKSTVNLILGFVDESCV